MRCCPTAKLPSQALRPTPEPDGASGFTLLEVLVALVILALAVGALTGAIAQSTASVQRVDAQLHAVALADGILAGLGRDMPLKAGMSRGQDGALSWQLSITPQQEAGVVLARVDLTVTAHGHVVGQWASLRVLPP